MNRIFKLFIGLAISGMVFSACSEDFLDVNTDPKVAGSDQVKVEYFINAAITKAQMNPHIAERAFVLYWKTAARQHRVNGSLATGGYNDDWTTDYYRALAEWLNVAELAIRYSEENIAKGNTFAYSGNLLQVARIWRVYLMTEYTDAFGPMPIDGFSGQNPEFQDVKTVYYHLLSELKDAVSKIDLTVAQPTHIQDYDKAYGYNFEKWARYGNSMRLRLAMRLSEVDPAKARQEFEDAVQGMLILNAGDIFQVAEKPGGWDDLTGVMSREWNTQPLSATLNNLYVGLGGIKSEDQLPTELHTHIKPSNWMGVKYEDHFGVVTNDPSAGFWFDGLHETIDPRAYKAFIIPGYFSNPNFSFFPSWTNDVRITKRRLLDANNQLLDSVEGAFTWNAACLGNWGVKAQRNQVAFHIGSIPRLAQNYRDGNKRIFFAHWETYFLIAEAAVRGWNVPMDAKTAYENGVKASLAYFGVSEFANAYLASEDYNRAGTSVSWDHTTEPPATVSMAYVNGYTQEAGTYQMKYPVNHLHQNGSVKNDALTKIITQKYLAQLPYLPLETWNDHRRLGLPFFENPSVELPLVNLPALTQATAMESRVAHFPQRIKYPSSLANSNPMGYEQAVGFLGGADAVLTPLWWAKK